MLHHSVFLSIIPLMIIQKAVTSPCIAPSQNGIGAGHHKSAADDALCIETGL